MNDNSQTLFDFPVVVTDAAPEAEGEVILGRFPTWQDLVNYGSFEAAIEAQKEQWAKIKISETDNQ